MSNCRLALMQETTIVIIIRRRISRRSSSGRIQNDCARVIVTRMSSRGTNRSAEETVFVAIGIRCVFESLERGEGVLGRIEFLLGRHRRRGRRPGSAAAAAVSRGRILGKGERFAGVEAGGRALLQLGAEDVARRVALHERGDGAARGEQALVLGAGEAAVVVAGGRELGGGGVDGIGGGGGIAEDRFCELR